MNYCFVVNQLGKLMVVFSAVMGALALVALLIDAAEGRRINVGAEEALIASGAACFVIGAAASLLTRGCERYLGRREAMLLVAASWVIGAAFAALPFFAWARLFGTGGAEHPFWWYHNCYFEAMSGLTTTGATILSEIESLPRELLLWRAFTHWVGGLGIVVLFVAVLPSLGVGGKRLFQIEAPGPAPEGLQPQIRDTARILWLIYMGLTVLEALALWLGGGMNVFDSVCHTFATLATGGFSTRNASVGAYYDKAAVDAIVIVFMVIAGANFGLYYQLWRGRVRSVWKDAELRVYLTMLFVGTLLVAASLAAASKPLVLTTGQEVVPSVAASLRNGAFTTISVQTTTGFCAADFNRWPFLAQAVLVAFMFVGGCSGSTAGGIKVIRIWIALKVLLVETERFFRPGVVRPIRVSGATIDRQLQLSTLAFILGIVLIFLFGWGAIMLLEQANPSSTCSSATAATASVATLCTIGPGLDGVGAVENYGWFSTPSKLLMCLLMALGRLEVFAVVVLFQPGFWERR